jgi:polysaccharide deacetylase 2 family uncharacterized protein YibQ
VKHLGTFFWIVILCGSVGIMGAGFFGGQTLHASTVAQIQPQRALPPPPAPAVAREVNRQLAGSHSLLADTSRDAADSDDDAPPIGDVVVNRPDWAPSFDAHSTSTRPRIVLIVADAGRALPLDSEFAALPAQLTFAVDPDAGDTSDFVHAAGASHAILVEVPNAFFSKATSRQLETLDSNLSSYAASGVLTPISGEVDGAAAKRIVKHLPSADILVDGMAGDAPTVYRLAKASSLSSITRDVVADAYDQTGYIGFMLRQAGEMAQRTGVAVVVVRSRLETLRAIRDILPIYERDGIDVVPVTALAPQAVTQR